MFMTSRNICCLIGDFETHVLLETRVSNHTSKLACRPQLRRPNLVAKMSTCQT